MHFLIQLSQSLWVEEEVKYEKENGGLTSGATRASVKRKDFFNTKFFETNEINTKLNILAIFDFFESFLSNC